MIFPTTLYSQRLTLRPVSIHDYAVIHLNANNPQYSKFLPYELPQTEEQTEKFIAKLLSGDPDRLRSNIIELDGIPIGLTRFSIKNQGVEAEIGYGLWHDYWGKGYATESLQLLTDSIFHNISDIERIAAHADPRNPASIRVMEKAGFSHEGTMRKALLTKGILHDRMNLAILRDEWNSIDRTKHWNLSDDHIIETTNLILRQRKEEDTEVIFAASRHKGFNDGMCWDPPKDIRELEPVYQSNIEAWRTGSSYPLSICLKNGQMIGSIGIRPDARDPNNTKKKNIGFWIAPDCQSKGYTTEATKALLEFGFRQYGAESITADHLDWNIASKRVLEKSGFKWKQSFPKDYLKNNKWETSEYYVINKKQFQNIQS